VSALTLDAMVALLGPLLRLLIAPANRRDLALRQQVARPRLQGMDCFSWIWLFTTGKDWRRACGRNGFNQLEDFTEPRSRHRATGRDYGLWAAVFAANAPLLRFGEGQELGEGSEAVALGYPVMPVGDGFGDRFLHVHSSQLG
jgi:hypothetical protein